MRQPDTSELEAVAHTARKPGVSHRDERPTTRSHSDRILIAAIAQRDQAAFSELHSRYHRRIARFVSASLPRCTAAEEIINDTLWIVWQSPGELQGTSEAYTGVMHVAVPLDEH